jgi:hypothetical protein
MISDGIDSLTADTSDSEYPVSNLLDIYPQKRWQSLSSTSVLTILTTPSVSGIFICGTNAEAYIVTVKSIALALYETHTGTIANGRLFLLFDSTYSVNSVRIDITLVTSGPEGEDVYAGILRCGSVLDLPDPQYGLKSERQDFSIKSEFSNGGLYVYKRQTPRAYELSLTLTHAEFEELDDLYDTVGSAPFPFLLAEEINRPDYWSGFFHVVDPPSGSYAYPTFIDCSLSLREAV